MNWEQLRRMMTGGRLSEEDLQNLIGETMFFTFVSDETTMPTYSGRPDDREEHRSQYNAREKEYQRQRRQNDPGTSDDLPHGYHDYMQSRTYLNWKGMRGWVTDESLARHKCWKCLLGTPHMEDMCEKWRFPEPTHYDMGFNTKHNYKMAYGYDLYIPEDLEPAVIDDGAFVITGLDKVYPTDIALYHGE